MKTRFILFLLLIACMLSAGEVWEPYLTAKHPDRLLMNSTLPDSTIRMLPGHMKLKVKTGHLPTENRPLISGLTYDSIEPTSVVMFWTTNTPADSRIFYMLSDSNYQPVVYTDSVYIPGMVTHHVVPVNNLQPAMIYKYLITSENADGFASDSGYFLTKSNSSGITNVYFNHSVDTTVHTGEYAKGNQDFSSLLIHFINNAGYSIDITLWEFSWYSNIAAALVNAKNRGVKIRFIYNHSPNTPQIDSLLANEIPVIKRNFDTTCSMHNKFWIFDYRYNNNSNNKYLWTGSTNISHAQLHSDRNNVIVIQDEALCAVFTREFEEMWGSHTDLPDTSQARFGSLKTDNVPHILNVKGSRMEIYFAPSDSVCSHLNNLVLTYPTKSLYFSMLKFYLPSFEDILHIAFNNGLAVKGVFDLSNSLINGNAYPRMKGLPVPNSWDPPADVFVDTIPGLIHHKYCLIDASSSTGNKITTTGSYNWELPAETGNDDNMLVVFDERITNLYYQEFQQRYTESGGEYIGVEDIGNSIFPVYQFQNFPNPFSCSTTFIYEIAEAGFLRLEILDIHGRLVKLIVNEKQNAGNHRISWNAENQPDGIYFYSIKSDKFHITRKMILLR